MRTRLALAAVGMLALATAAYSQWCPNCYMVSYVDVPAAGPATTVSVQGFLVAGWGFVCEGGAPADRVDVWYQKDDGYYDYLPQPDGTLVWGLYRPDVQQAYATHCPGVTSTSGWHFYVANTPPPGTRYIVINVWRGPFLEGHTRLVTVE